MRIGNRWRLLTDRLPVARKRREEGQALVEFALVSPLLLLILFAIIQFGIMLSDYITVTDSARIGAQQLALGSGLSDPCDRAVLDAYNAGSSINLQSTGTVTPSFATGTDYCGATSSTSNTACTPYVYNTSCNSNGNEASGDEATVTVTEPFRWTLFGLEFGTINLSATASDAIQ
jgi:Flp pilus assembly protein TadG